MLRLVSSAGDSDSTQNQPENLLLREALAQVTLGGDGPWVRFVFDAEEAGVMYELLRSRSFTQTQMDTWLAKLAGDNPWNRRSGTIEEWKVQAQAFIDETINSVENPDWIEDSLRGLARVTRLARNRTGRGRWAVIVMRWALVHLLTTPAHAPSGCATG